MPCLTNSKTIINLFINFCFCSTFFDTIKTTENTCLNIVRPIHPHKKNLGQVFHFSPMNKQGRN